MGKSWEIIRKSLKVVINSWEIQQTVMRKLWESHEKAGNSHDFLMRIMKKSWQWYDKFMIKFWEIQERVLRKAW